MLIRITVEFHFYLVLPVLLWLSSKSRGLPLGLIVVAMLLRLGLYQANGEIQTLSYWTILGRIDQFVLGMLAFNFREYIAGRHWRMFGIMLLFSAIYACFDLRGGFYHYPVYPSPSRLWIILPSIEGFAYAALIAWYETSFEHGKGVGSRLMGRLGEYSYSIYLLHFFVVFEMARIIDQHLMAIGNFYLACLWSALCFLCMLPIGYLSFRFIEAPFLRHRRLYALSKSSR